MLLVQQDSELIPLLSFLIQRGKCRKCSSKVSWQYPLIELLTGLLFVLITFTYIPQDVSGAALLAAHLVIACLLVVILIYDAKHKIIPDPLVYTFIALTGIMLFIGGDTSGNAAISAASEVSQAFHMPTLSAVLAGPLLFIPFALIWRLSKGRAMGFGDAKLAWGMGWSVGLAQGISAVVFAFWIGAAVGITKIIIDRIRSSGRPHITMKSEIPFAPFLIIGLYVALWIGADIYHVDFFVNSFLSVR
jgi:leader peptidase (prepilin peptidase) / N-methyltransferase